MSLTIVGNVSSFTLSAVAWTVQATTFGYILCINIFTALSLHSEKKGGHRDVMVTKHSRYILKEHFLNENIKQIICKTLQSFVE